MTIARQNTARTVMIGPVLDADGVAVTGGVVADFKGSVNGGAPAALNGSATLTHRHTGFYSLALTATDLATVGSFEVVIDDTVNCCPMRTITVVEEAVYDALFAASALGYVANAPVNVAQISGDSTAADNAESFFDGTGYAGTNNVIPTVTTTGTATNVTTVNGLAANVITATSIATDAFTSAKFANDFLTAAKIANGAIDAATFAADVDAEILSYLVDDATRIDASALNTATATTIPTNLDAAVSTRATPAQVNSEVDTALADIRLDELLAADSDIDGAAPPTVGSVFHELMTKTTGSFTYDQTTDSLEAVRDRGDAAWVTATGFSTLDAAGVRAAVGLASANLDTQLGDLPTNGELATALAGADDATLAAIAALNNLSAAQVNAEVDAALADIHLDHLLATTYDPASKPGAADALLNELVESDGGVARYTANALEQGPSGGGGVADWTADERTALRAILGIPASGTTPDDPTTGILDTIRDAVAGVQSDTNDIQTRLPAALVGGRIDANVGAISSDSTAADNAEAFFDGTGYAGTGNVIPTVTTVTNLHASAATAAELAKVPKSDGTATWNATALASINAEADVALADVGLTTTITGRIDAAVTSRMATYTQPTGFLAATFPGTVASTTNITAGTITTATNVTTVNGLAAGVITASSIAADAITDAKVASDVTIASVTGNVGGIAGTTTTLDALQTALNSAHGAGSWATATGFSTLDAAGVRTAVGLASANLDTQLSTIDDFLDTEVAAIKAKTDNLPASPASAGDIPTVSQIWTTALTEAYAADGSTFTGAQAMYMIWSALSEFAIAGTTITCKKLDGVTTSLTFTLDSSSSPTSRARAT